MTDASISATLGPSPRRPHAGSCACSTTSRFLVVICLLPAVGLLMIFLTYPLGLGIWLAFTDTTIGRRGVLVGLENFQYLLSDPILLERGLLQRLLHRASRPSENSRLGLWLALLLNNHLPFKSLLRAIILLPWIVPTVLSAHRVLVDLRSAVLDHLLSAGRRGLRETNVDFLGIRRGRRACR